MTPKRTGKLAGAPLALPKVTPQKQQKYEVSSRQWPTLSQHLSLNQEIPAGRGAGKDRRLEERRTWRKGTCQALTVVSRVCQ